MIDFPRARRVMVDTQIRVNDVVDPRLLEALEETPREVFAPPQSRALAYLDDDLAVEGETGRRFILEPMVFAKLVQAADIRPDDIVLDVGCATGYSAAVLSRVAGVVVAVEEDARLASTAAKTLEDLGLGSIALVRGPLAAGAAQHAPFDAIILEGAVSEVPASLLAQLKEGGRLVAVVGAGRAAKAHVFTRVGEDFSARAVFDAASPTLPGFARAPGFVF